MYIEINGRTYTPEDLEQAENSVEQVEYDADGTRVTQIRTGSGCIAVAGGLHGDIRVQN